MKIFDPFGSDTNIVMNRNPDLYFGNIFNLVLFSISNK